MGFFDPPEKPNYEVSLYVHLNMFGEAAVRIPIDGEWRMHGKQIKYIGFYILTIDCTVCTPDTGLDP